MGLNYDYLAKLFSYESENEEERQKRGILIMLVGLTCLAGLLYSLIYVLLGVYSAIAAIQVYIAFAIVNLVLFYFTKDYSVFRSAQLVGICLFPTVTHTVNGGFEQSSAVIMAAMMSPLGAIMFHTPKAATRYFVLFLLCVLSGVFIDLYMDITVYELAKEVKMTFYFFNIASVTSISFFLLRGFVIENEEYKNLLQKQNIELENEKGRSEQLLLNILPVEVADELKEKGHANAQLIDFATVLFTDFKEFTQMSELMTPQDLVSEINYCFCAFDRIMEKYGVEKIKTIGDAYMAAGGLPSPNKTHAIDVVCAALEIQEFIAERVIERKESGLPFFEIRIGIHTGPVVAGIVGIRKFQYDIWGDTVNTANRMETSGAIGKVNVSETTYELVKNAFQCEFRGEIEAKGKGKVKMYFVEK